jgi:dienelactone hydrolase
VLLLQGADDAVVPPSQAEAIRDALAARGIPHAYVLYEGEDTGSAAPRRSCTRWRASSLSSARCSASDARRAADRADGRLGVRQSA